MVMTSYDPEGFNLIVRHMLKAGHCRAAWAGFPSLHRNPSEHQTRLDIWLRPNQGEWLACTFKLFQNDLQRVHPMDGPLIVRYLRFRLYREIKALLTLVDPGSYVIDSIRVSRFTDASKIEGGDDALAGLIRIKLIALD